MVEVPYPTYEDVMAECERLASHRPEFTRLEEAGRSEEGRPIPLLTITDPAIPAESKSVFFATGGTHGSEEAGRAVALALARCLLEPQNRHHLRRQVFLIAPCVNPDGAVRNTYHNAGDVNVYQSYPLDAPPKTAEAAAMLNVLDEWIPDCVVDCHGLAGGAMGDGEYIHPTINRDWSLTVSVQVSRRMDDAAERAGYPQRVPHFRLEPDGSLPCFAARKDSALAFTVETTENYYPIEDSVASGVARLMELVRIGEESGFFTPYPNYPCDVVSGNRLGAVMPLGDDYSERRRCRRAISRMIMEGVPWLGRGAADRDWKAQVSFPVEEHVKTLPEGLVVQLTLDRRAEVESVSWNGKRLDDALWRLWAEPSGLVVRAEVHEPPAKGENCLEVAYGVPFKRHAEPKPTE